MAVISSSEKDASGDNPSFLPPSPWSFLLLSLSLPGHPHRLRTEETISELGLLWLNSTYRATLWPWFAPQLARVGGLGQAPVLVNPNHSPWQLLIHSCVPVPRMAQGAE